MSSNDLLLTIGINCMGCNHLSRGDCLHGFGYTDIIITHIYI